MKLKSRNRSEISSKEDWIEFQGPLKLIAIADSITMDRSDYFRCFRDAYNALETAAEKDRNGDAAAAIAHMYVNGSIKCQRSDQRAQHWINLAIRYGSAYGHWLRGWSLFENGRVGNALLTLEKAASMGFSPAAHDLGVIYQRGWGVDVDLQKSLTYFRQARELGHIIANWSIRNIIVTGKFGFSNAVLSVMLRPLSLMRKNLRLFFGPVLSMNSLGYPFGDKRKPRNIDI